jgi:ATP-binding cassette subfamily C protein
MQAALLSIKQSIPIAERALQFLSAEREEKPFSTAPAQDTFQSSEAVRVNLADISFQYPGSSESTLRGITFEIHPGQQVALIGPSGAGKSTIADLILGLLVPTQGRVLVAGEEPKQLILTNPGRLAYVPQRPGMVSGSVAENIALGTSEAELDLDRLRSAISASHLDRVLENLPDGINTNLGKRKDELSGGQLQRIGLARALYPEPGLLVMDEATSALDAESENEINKALDEMRGKVTVILIAHRLNTVQRSDMVFLVEGGKITASGTFPELLKSNKTVQNLAKLMSIDSGANSQV